MDIKKTILSRFFKTKPAVEEPEEALPETAAAGKSHSPASVQPVEVLPEEPVRHVLELPESHAVYGLCRIFREQAGTWVQPELALEGPDDPILPEKEGKEELQRLYTLLTSTASKRLKQAQPLKGADGEPDTWPDVDAEVIVFVAKNDLTAWVLAYPHVGGGQPLDRETVSNALAKHRVSYGVDEPLLDALAKDPQRCFRLFVAARGEAPVPGEDGQAVENFPRSMDHQPMEDENGRVDYANLGLINNVEQGAEICRILPPTTGTPGRTVQGREIRARDGKPAYVPKGKNTELSEDGQSLVASMSGHLEYSGRNFQVKPVMDIPGNVDFSVGNISFFGDVCIHGDVGSGFTVKATGNVTIDGVVEASAIEAGKNLVVVKGVQGDSQAVLRAQGSIYAKYLENCCVYAKQNVETEAIINCDVYCGGVVTACSGHGKIFGGKIWAGERVHAGIMGSRSGSRTDVILGGQPCEDFDYEQMTKEIQELEKELEKTKRRPASPDKDRKIGKIKMQLTLNRSKLSALEKERENQPQETLDTGGRTMKCSTVNAGTVLTIGPVVYHFKDTLTPCLARLVNGELRLI